MKNKEDSGCIQYIKKTKQIVLSYSMSDGAEVGNVEIANIKETKIKNDYELMSCIYSAINKSINSINPALKKYSNCIKLISESKQIRFKVERENKKTYIIMPEPSNPEEQWVRIYSTTSPFTSIAKAALEYNKQIVDEMGSIQK